MRERTLDSEIVFRDLTKANKKLRHKITNPDAIRRWFTEFVNQSQKLTLTMRKEYSALTKLKWEAIYFTGWTPITEFFKELRNADQHELPIRISLIQTQEYPCVEIGVDESGKEIEIPGIFSVQAGTTPEAGFEKKLPNPITVNLIEQHNIDMGPIPPPTKISFEFHVEGQTPKTQEMLKGIGNSNLHELTAQCYKTLSDYYNYYKARLSANRNS